MLGSLPFSSSFVLCSDRDASASCGRPGVFSGGASCVVVSVCPKSVMEQSPTYPSCSCHIYLFDIGKVYSSCLSRCTGHVLPTWWIGLPTFRNYIARRQESSLLAVILRIGETGWTIAIQCPGPGMLIVGLDDVYTTPVGELTANELRYFSFLCEALAEFITLYPAWSKLTSSSAAESPSWAASEWIETVDMVS